MNVKVENIEKNVVQLEIEVESGKFEQGMQKSYLKNVKKYNVPGFRKGKAPRNIIERYYGEQVFYEDAINIVCADAYDEAVEQNNIFPVDRPDIDIKQIGKGENLIFTASVTVKPEVELGQYKDIEVEKIETNVTDEDVDKEIQKTADKNARVITVEDRPIQTDDIAIINFEGFVDGVAFEGGKGEDFSLTIGSGQFIPGFEEQLIGLNAGEEKDVNVTFPEDYNSVELAGKPTLFKVKVNEIKFREIPALDDEFAKDVSEFDTLAEYKEDVKKQLVKTAEQKAEHETEDKVVDKVVENTNIEVPQVMVDKRVESLIYDFQMRLQYQGLDLGHYMSMMGMDMDTFKQQFAVRAEKEVKSQLVLEKVGQVENIDATEEELSEEIKKLAENYKQSEEDFKKYLKDDDMEYIKKDLILKKTVGFLMENAKIV